MSAAASVPVELVLGGRRDGDLGGHLPDASIRYEPGRGAPVGVRGDALTLDLLDLLEQLDVDPGLVDDVAGRVGRGDRAGAELGELLDGVDRDVARAGHHGGAPLESLAAALQHLLEEEHGAVARRLRTYLRAAPQHALAGEHARFVAVRQASVLAEEISDLASPHADVTSRDVGVLTEVAVQLRHEALREALDLAVASPVRIEVRPALRPADALTGEGVLQDLLEAEELDDAEIDTGVEAQPALVRPEGGVELHPEAAVHLHAPRVIDPRHAEHDLPLGFDEPLHDAGFDVLGVAFQHRSDRFEHLVKGLMELGFVRVAGDGGAVDLVEGGLEVHERDGAFSPDGGAGGADDLSPPGGR